MTMFLRASQRVRASCGCGCGCGCGCVLPSGAYSEDHPRELHYIHIHVLVKSCGVPGRHGTLRTIVVEIVQSLPSLPARHGTLRTSSVVGIVPRVP
jgi:hypothetical protein